MTRPAAVMERIIATSVEGVDGVDRAAASAQPPTGDAPPRTVAEVTPAAVRESVVRRLLARGLTPRTLTVLLPDWAPMIAGLAGEDRR